MLQATIAQIRMGILIITTVIQVTIIQIQERLVPEIHLPIFGIITQHPLKALFTVLPHIPRLLMICIKVHQHYITPLQAIAVHCMIQFGINNKDCYYQLSPK